MSLGEYALRVVLMKDDKTVWVDLCHNLINSIKILLFIIFQRLVEGEEAKRKRYSTENNDVDAAQSKQWVWRKVFSSLHDTQQLDHSLMPAALWFSQLSHILHPFQLPPTKAYFPCFFPLLFFVVGSVLLLLFFILYFALKCDTKKHKHRHIFIVFEETEKCLHYTKLPFC